jgi:Icc-related predicted phosphoesterase
VLLVSDVHGEWEGLANLARSEETLLILGDLINLIDYRTNEGIIADVLGKEFGSEVADHRAAGDYESMRRAWNEVVGSRRDEVRAAMDARIRQEYELCRQALAPAVGFCTYGNVDRPELLAAALPATMPLLDGQTVMIEGMTFGFVGGGVATPVGAAGEVTDELMAAKLEAIGEVEVLCSHLPPALDPLSTDVITGRRERSSRPILDYLRRIEPRFHFYGDVHQPQAISWRLGTTVCRNVGYFRATKRPVRLVIEDGVPHLRS